MAEHIDDPTWQSFVDRNSATRAVEIAPLEA